MHWGGDTIQGILFISDEYAECEAERVKQRIVHVSGAERQKIGVYCQ